MPSAITAGDFCVLYPLSLPALAAFLPRVNGGLQRKDLMLSAFPAGGFLCFLPSAFTCRFTYTGEWVSGSSPRDQTLISNALRRICRSTFGSKRPDVERQIRTSGERRAALQAFAAEPLSGCCPVLPVILCTSFCARRCSCLAVDSGSWSKRLGEQAGRSLYRRLPPPPPSLLPWPACRFLSAGT